MYCCGSGMSSKHTVRMIARVSLGLSLLFIGVAHYRDANAYAAFVASGTGSLESLARMWGYVLPALMMFGGACLTLGFCMKLGTWASGLALGSIPAGMLLKAAMGTTTLDLAMPAAINAFVWLLLLMFVVKSGRSWFAACECGDGCGCCEGGACEMPMPAMAKPKTVGKKKK